jgi:hypothetical protein
MNNFVIDILRGATRPIVTVIFAAVIAQVIVEKINAPDWFIALACGVILWWFGDRTVQHLKEKHVLERSEGKEQS